VYGAWHAKATTHRAIDTLKRSSAEPQAVQVRQRQGPSSAVAIIAHARRSTLEPVDCPERKYSNIRPCPADPIKQQPRYIWIRISIVPGSAQPTGLCGSSSSATTEKRKTCWAATLPNKAKAVKYKEIGLMSPRPMRCLRGHAPCT
jgi:hypothetical protein